jgi:hypothetical protein
VVTKVNVGLRFESGSSDRSTTETKTFYIVLSLDSKLQMRIKYNCIKLLPVKLMKWSSKGQVQCRIGPGAGGGKVNS